MSECSAVGVERIARMPHKTMTARLPVAVGCAGGASAVSEYRKLSCILYISCSMCHVSCVMCYSCVACSFLLSPRARVCGTCSKRQARLISSGVQGLGF